LGHSIGSPRGVRTAAVIVAAARYAKVLDWAGPNLASNQVVIYAPNGGQSHGSWDLPQGRLRSMAKTVDAIGSASGAQRLLHLETARASLITPLRTRPVGTDMTAPRRSWVHSDHGPGDRP